MTPQQIEAKHKQEYSYYAEDKANHKVPDDMTYPQYLDRYSGPQAAKAVMDHLTDKLHTAPESLSDDELEWLEAVTRPTHQNRPQVPRRGV